MKKRFSEEQIVSMLREAEVGELPAKELCRNTGFPSRRSIAGKPSTAAWKSLTPGA